MELLKLEVECPRCAGESLGAVTCGECDGSGKVVTPQGEALIRFLAEYTIDVTDAVVRRR